MDSLMQFVIMLFCILYIISGLFMVLILESPSEETDKPATTALVWIFGILLGPAAVIVVIVGVIAFYILVFVLSPIALTVQKIIRFFKSNRLREINI